MKMLRINLRIRADASPRLYAALSDLPPRPRAELLRRLAEIGLHPFSVSAPLSQHQEPNAGVPVPPGGSAADREVFGAELLRVVGDLP